MPALKNTRHERFAQELAKGKSQAEAYELAGYAPSEPNASRLTRNDKVQARVVELQNRAAARAEMTLQTHLDDLAELRDAAKQARQYSAAISAEIARGKAAGVHVEKTEQTVNGALSVTYVTSATGPAPTPSEEDYETT